MSTKNEYVIYNKAKPNTIWNIYGSKERAEEVLNDLKTSKIRSCLDTGYDTVGTFDEFLELQEKYNRETLLTPAEQISPDEFYEALGALPPENWQNDSFEHFRMMEYYTADYTKQYARFGDIYIEKMIKVSDPTTWITIDDFEPYYA